MIIVIRCCECGKEIDGDPYLFGGNFACKECVENYYKRMEYSQDTIDFELAERKFAACRMIRKKV